MSYRAIVTSILAASLVVGLAVDASSARSRKRRVVRRSSATVRRPAEIVLPASLLLPPDATERDRMIGDAALAALERRNGSVVALDPRTGRVMAIVNPQTGLEHAYTPCSVFKIVVAIGGLSEGIITPETKYNCTQGCWTWPGHGPIDLRRAIAVSCNPYFEWIGEQLGYDRIQKYAHLLGLGSPSGINLTDEASGQIPDSVSEWKVGHLSSHAAGITTTAVQLGVLLSATVNGGVVYQPQLAGIGGFTPRERWHLPPQVKLDGLAAGFLAAVDEGSATSAFDPEILMGGKTGSCAHLGWFASYAPTDHPELVIVVLLRPGNGHQASAVAGRIYQTLYKSNASSSLVLGSR